MRWLSPERIADHAAARRRRRRRRAAARRRPLVGAGASPTCAPRAVPPTCRSSPPAVSSSPTPSCWRRSTVPAGVAREAHRYLAAGGPTNLAQLVRFLSDTVLLTGFGFDAADDDPRRHGVGRRRPRRARRAASAGATAGRRSSSTAPTSWPGTRRRSATWRRRSRPPAPTCWPSPRTRCAPMPPGGSRRWSCAASTASTSSSRRRWPPARTNADGDGWSVPGLDALGIPVIQSPSTPASRPAWLDDDAGLGPLDVASGVAVPEFDGRIIGPTFAFKEVVDDDAGRGRRDHRGACRPRAHRAPRRASPCARPACATSPTRDKRVAIVLSAYPTKRARLGNAVGLDTPASAIELLHALRDDGYRVDRIPTDGDALMDELADRVHLRPAGADGRPGRGGGRVAGPSPRTTTWFASLPDAARDGVESVWGPAPGEVYVADGRAAVHRASTSAACSSRSSRRAASAPTRSARTTPPTSRRPTTTWRSTAG